MSLAASQLLWRIKWPASGVGTSGARADGFVWSAWRDLNRIYLESQIALELSHRHCLLQVLARQHAH